MLFDESELVYLRGLTQYDLSLIVSVLDCSSPETTPQTFQSVQSPTQNEAARLYFDIVKFNKLLCTESVLIIAMKEKKRVLPSS